jgi:predicted PurR-regulated permease PerM
VGAEAGAGPEAGPGARSQVSARTVWTVALHVLAVVVLVVLLRRAAPVISWLLVALLLALALDPVVAWLERRGWRRWLAVLTTLAALVLFTGLLLGSLFPMLLQQAKGLVAATPRLLDRLRDSELLAGLDQQHDIVARSRDWVAARAGLLTRPVLGALSNVLHLVAAAVAVFFLTAFMLLYGRGVVTSALEWIEPGARPRYRDLLLQMRRAVGGYVAGSLTVAGIGGAVTAVTTLLLGVPYFLPLGLAMAVLGLIPFLGVIIGGALVIGVTLASAGLKAGIIAAVVFLAYQQGENHFLQPMVQRHTIRLSPLLIACALLVGTALYGILGAVLALPVAGALQVLAEDALARRRARWQRG